MHGIMAYNNNKKRQQLVFSFCLYYVFVFGFSSSQMIMNESVHLSHNKISLRYILFSLVFFYCFCWCDGWILVMFSLCVFTVCDGVLSLVLRHKILCFIYVKFGCKILRERSREGVKELSNSLHPTNEWFACCIRTKVIHFSLSSYQSIQPAIAFKLQVFHIYIRDMLI